MKNNFLYVKKNIDNLLNQIDTFNSLNNGMKCILELKNSKDLISENYKDIAYYCEDFYIKGFEFSNDEDRYYFNDFFGKMGVFFCNKYIKSKGNEVFNDDKDVEFLIEMSMFYELAGRYDEHFDLLEDIVNNSNKNHLKIKAINEILDIGGLNDDIFDKYTALKNSIMENS